MKDLRLKLVLTLEIFLLSFSAWASIDRATFTRVIETAEPLFVKVAQSYNEDLIIYASWDDNWDQAFSRKWDGVTQILVYGGLPRRSEINQDAFALTLCHELGHAYGGAPYSDEWNRISVESQADTYGAGTCLEGLIRELPDPGVLEFPEAAWLHAQCQADRICERRFEAAWSLSVLFAHNHKQEEPRFDSPDLSRVDHTLLGYPKRAQCRLDTFSAALLGTERPTCWFNPKSSPGIHINEDKPPNPWEVE